MHRQEISWAQRIYAIACRDYCYRTYTPITSFFLIKYWNDLICIMYFRRWLFYFFPLFIVVQCKIGLKTMLVSCFILFQKRNEQIIVADINGSNCVDTVYHCVIRFQPFISIEKSNEIDELKIFAFFYCICKFQVPLLHIYFNFYVFLIIQIE